MKETTIFMNLFWSLTTVFIKISSRGLVGKSNEDGIAEWNLVQKHIYQVWRHMCIFIYFGYQKWLIELTKLMNIICIEQIFICCIFSWNSDWYMPFVIFHKSGDSNTTQMKKDWKGVQNNGLFLWLNVQFMLGKRRWLPPQDLFQLPLLQNPILTCILCLLEKVDLTCCPFYFEKPGEYFCKIWGEKNPVVFVFLFPFFFSFKNGY